MDVITPVSACPHCGLPLDAARPTAVVESAPPPAPPDVADILTPVAEPLAPEVTTFAPVAAAEPEPAPPAVAVSEFAPLFTYPDPEPAPPAAPPEPEEDPWINVPAGTVAAALEEPAPYAAAHARAESHAAELASAPVVDTGRGWGIRDIGPAAEPQTPVTTRLPELAHAALEQMAQPRPASPDHRTRNIRVGITAVAMAVLGAVTYAGVAGGALPRLFGSSTPIAAPATIGSLTRVSGARTDALLESVQAKVRASSATEAVAAVYGTGGTPQLVFVAYSGAATQTPDQLVATVNASGTPFTQPPMVSTVGGQQYVCGRVGAGTTPSVICTWTDSRAAGFVYAINSADVPSALHLADVARLSSEANR